MGIKGENECKILNCIVYSKHLKNVTYFCCHLIVVQFKKKICFLILHSYLLQGWHADKYFVFPYFAKCSAENGNM